MSWWQKLAGKFRGVFGGTGDASRACSHNEIQLRQGTAEFEEFIVRGELETTKNLKHAAGHLANLLSYDPGRREWIELLDKFLHEAGSDSEALIPRGDKLYFSTEALRAYIWKQQGRLVDAVDLVAQVTRQKPEARYLEAWVLDWLEPAGVVESLPREAALLVFSVALNRFPEAARSPLPRLRELRRHAALMDRWVAKQTSDGMTTMLHAGLHRKAGNFDRAAELVRAALDRKPEWATATALGLILREKGDAAEAERAFDLALQLDPNDISARLEAGDMFVQRQEWDSALRWYESALAKEPQHPWAKPSALFCRWKLSGDEARLQELTGMLKPAPGNERARQLVQMAYGGGLPEPCDATANIIRQFRQRIIENPSEPLGEGEVAITITILEAPSNYLAFRMEMAALGRDLRINVNVEKIPTPDPRQPIAPVDYVLWRYDGTMATPGLPAPGRDIAEWIAAIAAAPFDFAAYWAAASRAAEEFGPGRAAEILGAMVEPPPVPPVQSALSWLPRVQFVAAAIVAQVDSGWDNSVRRRALYSVLHGPMDWATGAAIEALAQIGRTEEAYAPDIHEAFQLLADHRPSHGHWGWERTLYECWLSLPHLFPKERDEIQRVLKRLASQN